MRRTAGTGSVFPFAFTASIRSTVTASRTSANVSSPSRISPGDAACSSRAATFTASPVAIVWSPAPTTTSPVFTPIRQASVIPWSRSRSSFNVVSADRMSAAARTALSASSSWTWGTPKTAMTASPMNFSTVPPWRSIAACMAAKKRCMTSRRDSGSSASPIAVEPTTSQKTIVTVLRTTDRGSASTRGAAHSMQNFAPAGFSWPQLEQVSTEGCYPARACRTSEAPFLRTADKSVSARRPWCQQQRTTVRRRHRGHAPASSRYDVPVRDRAFPRRAEFLDQARTSGGRDQFADADVGGQPVLPGTQRLSCPACEFEVELQGALSVARPAPRACFGIACGSRPAVGRRPIGGARARTTPRPTAPAPSSWLASRPTLSSDSACCSAATSSAMRSDASVE